VLCREGVAGPEQQPLSGEFLLFLLQCAVWVIAADFPWPVKDGQAMVAGQNTKLLTSEEEFSEGWVYGGFDAFTAHGQG
jgi:hypothetical protein